MYLLPRCLYLCQGGYVIVVVRLSVCLSVCLSATLHKNYWTDVHEIFREGWQQANDQIKFWLRSASQIQIVALVRRALVEVYTFSVLLLFERPFVKQFALCSRTVVCPVLSACDIAVLWPNSWTDQGATWHGDRPRPRPHCIKWGPNYP